MVSPSRQAIVSSCVLAVGLALAGGCEQNTPTPETSNAHTPAPTPAPVPRRTGQLEQVIALASGQFHTCALRADGTVWCWGLNASHQLGNGGNASSSFAIRVPGLQGIRSISSGPLSTCALDQEGTLRCWGFMQSNGSIAATPQRMDSLPPLIAFEGEPAHGVGRNQQGRVVYLDTLGQALSAGNDAGVRASWFLLDRASVRLVPSRSLFLLLDAQGRLFEGQWGMSAGGDASGWQRTITAMPVPNTNEVAALDASDTHACAVLRDGTVRCWGDNRLGALGDTTTVNRDVPTPVAGAAGHGACVCENASIVCGESNGSGALLGKSCAEFHDSAGVDRLSATRGRQSSSRGWNGKERCPRCSSLRV